MKREYDVSKFFRNPERAKRLRENGCRIIITDGKGENEKIVEDYFITPEQIAEENAKRDANVSRRRVQG